MSYYLSQMMMRKKVLNTIKTAQEEGVSEGELLVATQCEFPVGRRSVVQYIEDLKQSGIILSKDGVLVWSGKN